MALKVNKNKTNTKILQMNCVGSVTKNLFF